jgi:asparagine synthase (glutamine-hydrolysing)
MVIKGLFTFGAAIPQELVPSQKYEECKFKTGSLQIDKNWIRKINYKRFLIFYQGYNSNSCKNISAFISPENKEYFGEDVSADFFFKYIKNTENPISFAIYYDEVNQAIHIARNAFGTIPLFYLHIPNKLLAFSTDIPTLIGMKELAPYLSISSEKINSYLSRKDYALPYRSPTHFTHIHAILPGHFGSFTSSSVHQEMYVNYSQVSWKGLQSAEEYGAAFKDIFLDSVNREIPDHSTVGSHLSGGLDSSSVSSVIRYLQPNLKLHTFHTDTRTEQANEKHFAQEVADKIGSSHHTIYSKYDDLDSLILSTAINGQPICSSVGTTLLVNLFKKAHELRCDVILTGHDGDSVVGNGAHYLTELFADRNWKKLKEELSEIAKQDKFHIVFGEEWGSYSPDKRQGLLFRRYFERQLVEYLKTMSVSDAASLIFSGYSSFDISPNFFLRSGISRMKKIWKQRNRSSTIPRYIQNDALLSLDAAYEAPDHGLSFETHNKSYRELCYNQNVILSEELYVIGQHFDISMHHPFFDPKLYDFCQSIPSEILFDRGRGRGPLRTAMKGILPESVRNRTDKAAYNTYTRQQAIRLHKQSQDFLVDNAAVWNYVDKTKFHTAATILGQDRHPLATHSLMNFFVSRTIYLAVWLDTVGKAPYQASGSTLQ